MNHPPYDSWERRYLPFILVTLAALVIAFQQSPIFTLGTFVLFFIIYLWRFYDFRVSLAVGITLLLLGFALRLAGDEENAQNAGNAAYYFLLFGIVGEVFRYLRIPYSSTGMNQLHDEDIPGEDW